jgi:NADH dehydrogenase
MRVAVTGASGYIGSHLTRFLGARGVDVVPLMRRPTTGAPAWELGAQPHLDGVDVLVHCAHTFDDAERNVRGTELLYAAALRDGVSFIVYISSMAAFPGCKSVVGRTKLRIEEMTSRVGGLSVRPGTVWGGDGGGLMRSLENVVRKLPVVPLIGTGSQRLFLVNVDDLSGVIAHAIERREHARGRVLSVAHPTALTFREVLQQTADRFGLRRVFVPVPSAFMTASLRLTETFRIALPVRRDSIVSLMNANPAPDLTLPSDLAVPLRAFAST